MASAPRARSSFTTSARFRPAATISAVWPFAVSAALMSAPFSIRRVTVSVLPDFAASISGEAPVVVRTSAAAPAAISAATVVACPAWLARCSGV